MQGFSLKAQAVVLCQEEGQDRCRMEIPWVAAYELCWGTSELSLKTMF